MRAEPLLAQHRQKPWVSMAKIFEVEDLISHADGELSDPVDLVSSRSAGFKREMPTNPGSGMAFLEERAPKKRGGTTWRPRSFSLVRCNLKEPQR